jgi:hypothetical protein
MRYVEDYMPTRSIFDAFRANGYVTAFLEDEANWGTFLYWQPGFRKPPTDHYARVFMAARGRNKGFSNACCGNTSCNGVS